MKYSFLNPKQTAALLNLKESTLAAWRHHKRQPLNYTKVGNRVMYRESDIEAFLQSGYQVVTSFKNNSK